MTLSRARHSHLTRACPVRACLPACLMPMLVLLSGLFAGLTLSASAAGHAHAQVSTRAYLTCLVASYVSSADCRSPPSSALLTPGKADPRQLPPRSAVAPMPHVVSPSDRDLAIDKAPARSARACPPRQRLSRLPAAPARPRRSALLAHACPRALVARTRRIHPPIITQLQNLSFTLPTAADADGDSASSPSPSSVPSCMDTARAPSTTAAAAFAATG
ncbi:hypothetical protein V8E36_007639 [Tilletia maclaganii]